MKSAFSTAGIVLFFLGGLLLLACAVLMIVGVWTDRRLLLTGGVGIFIALVVCVVGSAMVQVDNTPTKGRSIR